MKKSLCIAAATSVLIISALSSWTAAVNDPCILDESNYCGTVRPGNAKLLECMEENSEKLSPACLDTIMKVGAQVRVVRASCAQDVINYCSAEPPQIMARIRCLDHWKAQMNPECLKNFKKLKAMPHQPDY